MNKKLIIMLFSICCLSKNSGAQNPIVQNLLNDVKIDSLLKFVRKLSGETPVVINGITDTIKSRQYQQPGNEKAFQFMKGEFIRFGYQVDSFEFNTMGKNLFAIKMGYKYPNKRYMLGAHYDNWPLTTIAPGADDNASGTAAVLEAGRVFANFNFPFTIVFALWDEEEAGLLGSTAYVPFIGTDNDTLLGYINLDMLGWDGNNDSVADLNVRPVANSVQLADKALQSNSIYNIGLNLHIVNPGSGSTDHAPFWYNGHTAIGIDEEYDNDFNPYWHTTADSVAQFNPYFFLRCAKLAYATLSDCAFDTVNVLDIQYFEKNVNLNVYPNPAYNHIFIRYPGRVDKIELANINGTCISEVNGFNQFLSMDISHLANGAYLIKLNTDIGILYKKFIIDR